MSPQTEPPDAWDVYERALRAAGRAYGVAVEQAQAAYIEASSIKPSGDDRISGPCGRLARAAEAEEIALEVARQDYHAAIKAALDVYLPLRPVA